MDVLRFMPDSTVVLDLPTGEVTLRAPNIGEWRLLFALWETADQILNDTAAAQRPGMLWGELITPNPYADALAETIAVLSSSAKPDPEKLPVWAGLPGIWPRLYTHWRVAQFEYVEAADPFMLPVEEPQPETETATPDPGQLPASRAAADGPIHPENLDDLRATAPVPATGGIGHQGEIGMG
jgi:hypothetical protein